MRRNEEGLILAGYSCPDCLSRALDFLELIVKLDSEISVSALAEAEAALGISE